MSVFEGVPGSSRKPLPYDYRFEGPIPGRPIIISCNFDSGNIEVVRQISETQYRLASVQDGQRSGHPVNSKSWFYFKVTGFAAASKVRFTVGRVQALISVFRVPNNSPQSKYPKSYRPVYRTNRTAWKHIPTEATLNLRDNGEMECTFDYIFRDDIEEVEFAFTYPYSFGECSDYIDSLDRFQTASHVYFHKEVLTYSPEGKPIHLLTITSPQHSNEKEAIFDQKLFPEQKRPLYFNKPTVLITARVHPGETSASYALEGAVNFLLNEKDLRSEMLRKMFLFMVVPMINPDGVYRGHFRMDSNGKNLNRYYLDPSPQNEPAIYGIKQLTAHLGSQNRLSFYFDLHAHNTKKGAFIYGNAINDFVEQVESQVFCKLFSLNHRGFEYSYCNFSEKHMNAKDSNDLLTKEGCGRVVMYRLTNIIHSYSLQCGIISPNFQEEHPEVSNLYFQAGEKGLTQDEPEESAVSTNYGSLFTQNTYRNIGKNMLVTILDVFDKNPYNRVYTSSYGSMDSLRRLTAFEVFRKAERFRMFERFIYGKVKNINELIKDVLRTKTHYKNLYDFTFQEDPKLKDITWPEGVLGLKPFKAHLRPKKAKDGLLPKGDYSESFMKALQENKMALTQRLRQANRLLWRQSNKEQQDNGSDEEPDVDMPKETFSSQLEQHSNTLPGDEDLPAAFHNEVEELNIDSNKNLSVRLSEGNATEEPSPLRIRKLLKHGSLLRSDISQASDTPESPVKQIYDKIRDEIRKELLKASKNQRAYAQRGRSFQPVHILSGDRAKSSTVNKSPSKFVIECRLPSIGSQLYVVSTSSKAIVKKY